MEKELSSVLQDNLLRILEERFNKNLNRHQGVTWSAVQGKLEANPSKLWSLNEMEATGGEPDVIYADQESEEYLFFDCSIESPDGRRSVCYDLEGLESRKAHKPKNNAVDMAAAMGAELLTKDDYRALQQHGDFDTKTSSWLATPEKIRSYGGAIFGDFRYGQVFI